MSSPGTGALRALRAGLLGLVCVVLALAGHLAGGGRAPSVWAVLILALPMAAVCLGLTARRRGAASIGAVVAGSQLVLHEALMWFQAGTTCTGATGLHAHHEQLAQLAHAAPVTDCRPMAGMGAALAAGPGASTALMVLGHALAAGLTTLLLAHGETLLWRLWDRLTRVPTPVPPVLSPWRPADPRPVRRPGRPAASRRDPATGPSGPGRGPRLTRADPGGGGPLRRPHPLPRDRTVRGAQRGPDMPVPHPNHPTYPRAAAGPPSSWRPPSSRRPHSSSRPARPRPTWSSPRTARPPAVRSR